MILLVEAGARQAMELDGMLRDAGHQVATVLSPETALSYAAGEAVELVLANLRLACDEAGLARALRDRGVPLIVYSTLPEEMAREILGTTAPAAVLRIPVGREPLLACVGQLLTAAAAARPPRARR